MSALRQIALSEKQEISFDAAIPSKLTNGKVSSPAIFDAVTPDAERIRRMGQEKARDWVLQYETTHGKLGRNDFCP